MPSDFGVRTISAPYAFRTFILSTLIFSGIVRISFILRAAHTMASPMPVLPEVGSIITVSLSIAPDDVASRIML